MKNRLAIGRQRQRVEPQAHCGRQVGKSALGEQPGGAGRNCKSKVVKVLGLTSPIYLQAQRLQVGACEISNLQSTPMRQLLERAVELDRKVHVAKRAAPRQ